MKKRDGDLTSFKDNNSLLIMGIAHHLNLHRNERFEPYGITGKQAGILTFLGFNSDKELTQKDFEEEFNLRPSTINSVLNYLEAGGFVSRSISERDGRAKIVTEQEKARALFEIILSVTQLEENLIVQGFTPEERIQLHDFLHRIRRNIVNSRDGDYD